ncbi:hypothetical protein CPAR01_15481 [Colletotrichum paranaense]|uniref:Uncharacterized protein n=1 Tax=Colletotrichum paranaense TaxID=1914294 RepID=A0ABQ9RZC0_9PEZI|nr:uncharacterized protein CPAR01_15481 [Colletotrichum paranaense]KAK1519988.1 hypothetical protein CPAR01_15481 [Colletotrichum paranaense]
MEDSVEQTTTTKIPNNHTNPSPKFQPVGSGKSGCLGLPVFSFPPFPPSRVQTDQDRPSCLGPSLAHPEILTLSSTHPLTHSLTHSHSLTHKAHTLPPSRPPPTSTTLISSSIIQTLFFHRDLVWCSPLFATALANLLGSDSPRYLLGRSILRRSSLMSNCIPRSFTTDSQLSQ